MTYSEDQVEWIVSEVLRRLGVAVGREANHGRIGGELAISDRVITMRLVEGRLNGVTRLLVQPGAVITPAVKDELKQRNIELIREARQ